MGCCASKNPQPIKNKNKDVARPEVPQKGPSSTPQTSASKASGVPAQLEPDILEDKSNEGKKMEEDKDQLEFVFRDAKSITNQKEFEEYFLDCVLHREEDEVKSILDHNYRQERTTVLQAAYLSARPDHGASAST